MKTLSLSKTIAVSLGALIVLLAVVFTLKAQTPTLNLKGGSKLVYAMQNSTVAMDATVIVNTIVPTISFKWKTSETVYGKVIFSQESYNSGRKISSRLFDDQKGELGFFWISKAMFTELSQGKTSFNLNGSEKMEGVVKAGIEQLEIKVNGVMKSLEVIHAKSVSASGGTDFYVLNDANNPLIIKLKTTDSGFSLKEITE
ncbi:hypothetical protein LBMAG27_15410 [Bacteroidota bacterium]|nr:hypothetical protein LBMAG27_15410 [Bacteroidota bacterium]